MPPSIYQVTAIKVGVGGGRSHRVMIYGLSKELLSSGLADGVNDSTRTFRA